MDKVVDKFHALQLFTDTFAAETVHLTNEAIGIYIRLLCFNWTKNTKPFTTESAYRICQCRSDECKQIVDLVLNEFFNKTGISENTDYWTHKRLKSEHEYLTAKYKKKSDAGKLGMEIRYGSVSNKSLTPIPKPIPIPNKYNKMEENGIQLAFTVFWELLNHKRGSKKLAWQRYLRECSEHNPEELAKQFNKYAETVDDKKKYLAHVSTWLSQRRFEDEANNKPKEIIIPPVIYNDEVLKKRGEFGHFEEYEDSKGNKYHKHKFKPNAKVEPVN